jgi:hypothetical protein
MAVITRDRYLPIYWTCLKWYESEARLAEVDGNLDRTFTESKNTMGRPIRLNLRYGKDLDHFYGLKNGPAA